MVVQIELIKLGGNEAILGLCIGVEILLGQIFSAKTLYDKFTRRKYLP